MSDSRSDVQELQTVSANVGRGHPSRCPAVNVQNRFNALREDGEVALTAPNLEPIAVALDADDTDSLASRSSCSAAADNVSGNGPVFRMRWRLVWDREQNGSILPGAIRRQRWSPTYVPLMWAAAGQAATGLLLEWLIVVTSGVSEPVTLFGGEMPVSVARVGCFDTPCLRGASTVRRSCQHGLEGAGLQRHDFKIVEGLYPTPHIYEQMTA